MAAIQILVNGTEVCVAATIDGSISATVACLPNVVDAFTRLHVAGVNEKRQRVLWLNHPITRGDEITSRIIEASESNPAPFIDDCRPWTGKRQAD